MAGNDWVNSYLEAILDVGQPLDDARPSLLLRERGRFTPSRYFVEEVITGYDETDLHRSWVKAVATRSPQERNTRLENMCWRIWNLARQKKQHEEKEAQRLAKRRLERERGRREATADMSEEFSEGEKVDLLSDVSTHGTKSRLPRINSAESMEIWANQQKGNKLYLVLISLHGLIRGENMELGRDSDTGGQVKYVVELARALGSMPGVYRVDLLTRQVSSPDVDWSYGEPTEMLTPRDSEDYSDEMGESSGAYIVRIPFGPKDKYIPKELLWPHIAEFVDGAMNHIMQMSSVLGEQVRGGKPIWPSAIHGHYADAGDAAALLSGALNVPMILTGHSLGRDKLEQLLKQGRLSKEEINSTYKIMRRIEGEELSLDVSEMVITSTRQEIDEQWRLYDGFDPILERKLRARIKRNVSCYGRFMPRMVKIPPGMEFNHIVPHDGDMEDPDGNEEHPTSRDPPIWAEIMRFFSNSRKPMILALARPDPKKNITTLVKAFGECRPLRDLANLALIMGNRDGIDEMSSTSSSVLLSVLKLIDKYDLYGQVAYPKHHKQSDVPDIYRLAAKSKGVFINPAFIEPFGLTLIEAAAHGLPMVATKNGGPVDIHRVLDNGLLVDPHDQQSISEALLKLVADKQLWAKCRQNGLKTAIAFLLLLFVRAAHSFYLPGVAPQDFEKGDELKVKVNKLTSIKTQLPYSYYSLPFCQPKKIVDSTENLGEVLRGDRIENAPYSFKMREAQMCNILCRVTLDAKTAKAFKEKIDDEYRVNMILDNLPLVVPIERVDQGSPAVVYQLGYHVGLKGQYEGSKEQKFFMHNHLAFTVRYHRDVETDAARIVGFEVKPYSVKHEYDGEWSEKTRLTTCDPHKKRLVVSSSTPQEVEQKKEIIFTYDVDFQESEVKWASRWDAYLLMNDNQIHWFSIVNSLMIVLFLSGMVAMIMLRTLYRDISRYNELETQEEAQEETGWKLVHGDVFRLPTNSDLLCVYVGTGVQCLGMVLVTMIFAMLGFLSPSNRGGLMTAMLLLWVFMGLFAGYASSRLYKMFKGTEWKRIAFRTAFLFPAVVSSIFFVLNALIWGQKSSGAVPFGTMFALIFLWFGISVPLVFVGAYLGFKKPAVDDPVKTNKIPRQIPEQAWYMNPVFSILIGGILPFGAVFIELFFILTSIWLNQFYYIFGFLFLVFVILIVTCAEITVVLCYFQLCSEDYLWWWRSYLTSGSSALYLFLYATFYFFTKLQITKLVSAMLYFGYMLIASYAFFVLTGTIGFYACLWFTRLIYSSVKID